MPEDPVLTAAGRVVDDEAGEAIEGATVRPFTPLSRRDREFDEKPTDGDGRFDLAQTRPKASREILLIQAEMSGYDVAQMGYRIRLDEFRAALGLCRLRNSLPETRSTGPGRRSTERGCSRSRSTRG